MPSRFLALRIPVPLAALALAACGDGAARPEPGTGRVNVVLILVDTLRKDRLSCYGHARETTPNLDRLAAGATRYERAFSQAPWTTPSIGSILTSQYPSTLGIVGERSALADDVVVLAEVLAEGGYVTGAVVSHSFCSAEWGFDQGFEYFDDSHVLGHSAVTSEGVSDRAVAFVEEFGGEDAPFFLWAHYFDPHCAYVEHEPYAFGGPGDYAGPIRSGQLFRRLQRITPDLEPRDAEELLRIYDSEIAYTDHHVGRLLAALDALGEDTLILFTSDHGEEFLDHGRLGHAKTLYGEVISAPLLIRYPGAEPAVVDEPVALLDLYPTVLDVVGLPAPAGLAGVSIAPGRGLDPERIVFAETGMLGGARAAVSRDHKLVVKARTGLEQLFDLVQDPSERLPRSVADLPDSARLVAALERFQREVQATGRTAPEVEVDADEAARLSDMGYAGEDE